MIKVMTYNINNFLDEIDIDVVIEEAVRIGCKTIDVIIEAPVWYDKEYDEYYTKEIARVKVNIEKDLAITIDDIIKYCYNKCKGE
jgi:hypothetical protein